MRETYNNNLNRGIFIERNLEQVYLNVYDIYMYFCMSDISSSRKVKTNSEIYLKQKNHHTLYYISLYNLSCFSYKGRKDWIAINIYKAIYIYIYNSVIYFYNGVYKNVVWVYYRKQRTYGIVFLVYNINVCFILNNRDVWDLVHWVCYIDFNIFYIIRIIHKNIDNLYVIAETHLNDINVCGNNRIYNTCIMKNFLVFAVDDVFIIMYFIDNILKISRGIEIDYGFKISNT